jgi:hypothetical protein
MSAPKVDVLADGKTSMFWAGRAAYQSGLTLAANPWDGNNPKEARADWSWRKGFASAENESRAALARVGG